MIKKEKCTENMKDELLKLEFHNFGAERERERVEGLFIQNISQFRYYNYIVLPIFIILF